MEKELPQEKRAQAVYDQVTLALKSNEMCGN